MRYDLFHLSMEGFSHRRLQPSIRLGLFGAKIKVEGTLGKDGVFHANTLLTSCPSKYEAEKEAGKMHPGTFPQADKYRKPGLNKAEALPKTTI